MPPLESLERSDALTLETPVERKRMLVIANPYATTVSERLKSLVVYALQGRYDVDAVDTEGRDHATELCREAAADGYDVVVAFGGDGTVNEAANGLAGSATALTPLPGGATNVYCRMLGIPRDIVDATEHLLAMADDWHPRKVDLGVVNGHCFTFNSGIGLDASVVEKVDARPKLKARFGPYFFTWKALGAAQRYLVRPPRMLIDTGEGTLEAVTTIVQNGAPYTYFNDKPIEIAEGAALDSGALTGAVLHRATPLTFSSFAVRTLAPRLSVVGNRQITGLERFGELTVRSADRRPLPLQVDGDFLGEVNEAHYSVKPRALAVVA
jgi:diacylglycerol kinase family enzyme